MLELTQWIKSSPFPGKPWLMVGKGPTFDRVHEFDLTRFNLLALNHVVNRLDVDVAHIIDVDAVRECSQRLTSACQWLVMPRRPHSANLPCPRSLESYFDELPVLRNIDQAGRLVWYNLAGNDPQGRSPVIGCRYFSSEAALNILGRMGVQTVRSLGIDGGRAYAAGFKDLEATTLLANGLPAFDLQFEQLRVVAEEYGIDFRPLVEPLHIFVGGGPESIVAYRVLEYSIRKCATTPVDITPVLDVPKRETPLSARALDIAKARFSIPSPCDHEGRVLCIEAHALVLGDVAELGTLPFGPAAVLVPPGPAADRALMLLDGGQLSWGAGKTVAGADDLPRRKGEGVPAAEVVREGGLASTIPPEWNHVEQYRPGSTRLLNYAAATTRPWASDDNPLAEVWMSLYREAVEAGAVPPDEVEALIASGQAKAGLSAALCRAPSRRSVLTGASLDLAMARHRIAELERKIDRLHESWSWRIGDPVARALRLPARLLRALRR